MFPIEGQEENVLRCVCQKWLGREAGGGLSIIAAALDEVVLTLVADRVQMRAKVGSWRRDWSGLDRGLFLRQAKLLVGALVVIGGPVRFLLLEQRRKPSLQRRQMEIQLSLLNELGVGVLRSAGRGWSRRSFKVRVRAIGEFTFEFILRGGSCPSI